VTPSSQSESHETRLGLTQMDTAWEYLADAKVRLRSEGFSTEAGQIDEAISIIAKVMAKVRP
jgi:hypothetical protein